MSNHAGALPPDASMIAKAIKEEHPRPRPVHLTVEHFFKGYPFFSMLVAKIGGVPAHPANVQRLLHDEEQLVLVFPEGRKGTEKLYKDRYKLRRFGRGGFVEAAMRAQVPIVPVAVVGAEEAMPMFAQLGAAPAADGAPVLPDHADVPALRAARLPRLPAGQVQDPLPRAGPDRPVGRRALARPGLVQSVADDIRARIQDELSTCSPTAARSGSDDARPRHRRSRASGAAGSPRRSSATPNVEVIVGVSPEDPTCELERTEYVRVGTQHALLRRIVRPPQIDTVVDSRLIVDSVMAVRARRARDQRHRDDEHPRRLRRARTRPCARSSSSRPRTTTAASRTTRPSSPSGCSARTRRARGSSATSSRPRGPSRAFAERNPDVTVTILRFVNGLGPGPAHLARRAALAARRAVILGFDPRYQFIHEDDIVGVLEHAVRQDLPGHLQRGRRRRARALGGREPARQAARAAAAAVGDRAGRRALRRAGVHPARDAQQLRYGRGVDNRRLKAAGAPLRHTTRETVQAFAEHLRVAAASAEGEGYQYEREVEEFLRWSPPVRRERRPPAKLQD